MIILDPLVDRSKQSTSSAREARLATAPVRLELKSLRAPDRYHIRWLESDQGNDTSERASGKSLRRDDAWPLPLAPFRECVVNAVAHRDYAILGSRVLVELFDDRLVVTSPGALPNHKRPESVLAGGTPRSRNEAMANCLFDFGLMEQRGSGFPRIARAMREFNGTAPLLECNRDERWVRVTLWRLAPEQSAG